MLGVQRVSIRCPHWKRRIQHSLALLLTLMFSWRFCNEAGGRMRVAPPRSGFNTAFSAAGFVRVRTVSAVAARNGILETVGLIARHTEQNGETTKRLLGTARAVRTVRICAAAGLGRPAVNPAIYLAI